MAIFKGSYHKALSRDVPRWEKIGWVTGEGAQQILAEIAPDQSTSRLPTIIGTLGAVLLGFAAMTFVAANWQEMSKLARMALLFGSLWTSFGAAWWLHSRKWDFLSEAALLTGAGLFGGNIMLISQMYHIDGHFPDGIMLWAAGSLLIAAVLNARAALALAFILITLWTTFESFSFNVVFHWPFLPVWLIATLLAVRARWRPSYHLSILSLIFWSHTNLTKLFIDKDWLPSGIIIILATIFIGLAAAAATAHKSGLTASLRNFDVAFLRYALILLLPLLLLFQFASAESVFFKKFLTANYLAQGWFLPAMVLLVAALALIADGVWHKALTKYDAAAFAGAGVWIWGFVLARKYLVTQTNFYGMVSTWVYGGLLLIFCIWLIEFGQRRHDRFIVMLGLVAFAAEILYIYFKVFGTLLETSLFFLIGGILLIGLAFMLEKLRRRLLGTSGEPSL